MKASFEKIDSVFDFTGAWGLLSKCGIKHLKYQGKDLVLVSELYKENPGTSITQVSASLAMQVCEKFNIEPGNLIYIEHSPDMSSKLSFYNEEYYKVGFDIVDGKFVNPSWSKLSPDDVKKYFE
jgi:hypothetical protein